MFERRGKFISIHGIDGTGKTSAAIEINKKLEKNGIPSVNYDSHEYKEKGDKLFDERKKKVDKEGTPEERLAVYLESMMYHSEKIDSLLKQGFHVVRSRYLDDIKAHFRHLGITEEKVEEILIEDRSRLDSTGNSVKKIEV